ncbi:unnamed protein product [Spodoptera littoralis]|uniref:VWFC domain-containing protein n=1 Tax=Spodoptera littoralis TaxID=7109 RepID=A0A9P0MYL8_SPOLI|nr:unnamed protein product [Spodoptera littoralis]CAH1634849.1 unnamed protein product [Spodoptera littoralis]
MFYCFFRMDWLTFQFYIVIWVLCTSVIKAQLSNPKMSHCVPGQPVPSPDKCNSCICYEGEIFCTNLPCPAPACTNGETLPNPDACNKCMCDNNKVACSDLICIPAPQCIEKKSYPPQNKCNVCMCLKGHIMCTTNICTIEKNVVQETFATNETIVDDSGKEALAVPLRVSASVKHVTTGDRTGSECDVNQPVYRPDDCNECYCFEGRLVCSDIICMRGSKCVEGQEIPKPDRCNSCRCIEGHILCTNRECPDTISKNSFGTESRARRLKPNEQCENGEAILPPPPPNDCNTCTCLNNRVICSHRECHDVDFIPEIKTRFITAEEEKKERNQLKEFDKQLSVEPIVDILLKSHEKRPSKLVRTHAYNGFQQEIKVHSGKISKDTSKLLKALATSLHNPALADIGDKLLYQKAHHLTSTNGDKINLSTKNSFDVQEIPVTQTSKIITSGSQGNETILVIPELLPKQNHVTVTPIMTHRETNWNPVTSPPPIINKNLFEMYSHEGKESNLLENQDSSKIISNKKHGIVNDLNKFDYLGQEHGMTLPRIMVTTPMGNSYSENLALQLTPHPINVNNGRPYSNYNDQYEALQYETRGKYADSFVTPTSNYSLITSAYEPSREYETYQIAPQNPYTTSIPIQLNENSINGNGNDYGNDNGNGNSNGNGNGNVNSSMRKRRRKLFNTTIPTKNCLKNVQIRVSYTKHVNRELVGSVIVMTANVMTKANTNVPRRKSAKCVMFILMVRCVLFC